MFVCAFACTCRCLLEISSVSFFWFSVLFSSSQLQLQPLLCYTLAQQSNASNIASRRLRCLPLFFHRITCSCKKARFALGCHVNDSLLIGLEFWYLVYTLKWQCCARDATHITCVAYTKCKAGLKATASADMASPPPSVPNVRTPPVVGP